MDKNEPLLYTTRTKNEFHRYNNEQKKADIGEYNPHDSIYMKFKIR